jgi:hypothetical protein
MTHYYRPERGDIILNPFDDRCAYWSPFDEIAHPADADRIAHQLISETGSHDDDVWLETSRILVANMLRALWSEGNCSLEALLDALQTKDTDELKRWLGGTSSARTFAEGAERATGSVIFMLAKAANLIQFLRSDGTGGVTSSAWTPMSASAPGSSSRARRITSKPPSRFSPAGSNAPPAPCLAFRPRPIGGYG